MQHALGGVQWEGVGWPQQAIRQATETRARISQISEDKAMYIAREKAIRDRKWELNAAFREGEREGEVKGKIELIRTLQGKLQTSVSEEQELRASPLTSILPLVPTSMLPVRGNLRPSTFSSSGAFGMLGLPSVR